MRAQAVSILALAAVATASPAARAGLSKEVGSKTMPAVVFLVAGDIKGGKLVPIASGSGSIITADGSILTNHHVIFNKKAHHLFDFVAVGLLKAFDQSPELTCVAIPAHGLIDRDLDLAVVKCETDLQGKPYHPSGWPTIAIGSSEDLVPGASELFIMGYPGVGGPTINVTRGTVSGFLGKEGGPGRFWIKTDAAIAHGNSGGTAVDDDGNLVGIPTAVFPGQADIGEKVGLVRPVEKARDLIARARAGWEPSAAATGSAEPAEHAAPQDPGLGSVACPFQKGVAISGQVLANDNHQGIEGAFVVVLKPDVTRSQVRDDYANLDSLYLTYAVSNQNGKFYLPCPVPRDQIYTVLVLAKGYVELSSDGILDTRSAPDRFEPWGGHVYLQRAK